MELYLVRLDRDRQDVIQLLSLQFLESRAMYGMANNSGTIPIPSIVDDVLYISTG